jgi:hypothetical protein
VGLDYVTYLKTIMEGEFESHIVDDLMYDGMIDIGGANGNIELTPIGERFAGKESQVEPQKHLSVEEGAWAPRAGQGCSNSVAAYAEKASSGGREVRRKDEMFVTRTGGYR